MGKRRGKKPRIKSIRSMIGLLALLLLMWMAVLLTAVLFIYAQWSKKTQEQQMNSLGLMNFSVNSIIRDTQRSLEYFIGKNSVETLLDVDTPEKLERNRQLLQDSYLQDNPYNSDVVVIMNFQNGRSYTSSPLVDADVFLKAMRLNTSNILHLFQTRRMPYEFVGLQPRESSSLFASMEKFCMARPLAREEDGEVIGMVIVTFARGKFRNTTGIGTLDGEKDFVLLNYRNEPFLTTRNMFLPQTIGYDTLTYGVNPAYERSQRGDPIVLYAEAEQPAGYRCVLISLRPEFRFFEMEGAVPVVLLSLAALLLLIGFAVSYLRKYRSILLTQNLLLHKGDAAVTKALLSGKQTLENLAALEILNLRSMEEQVHQGLAERRRAVLVGLFAGDTRPYEQVHRPEELGLSFVHEGFAVMAFRCPELEREAVAKRAAAQKEWQMLEFVVNNILREYHPCVSLLYKDQVVAVVNPAPDGKELTEVAELICTVCRGELETAFLVGISRTVGQLSRIADAYQESQFAVMQAAESGQTVLTYGDALKRMVPEQDYFRFIETQYYMISACKSRNWEDVAGLADDISGRVLAGPVSDIRLPKIQLLDMMKALIQQIRSTPGFPEEDIRRLSEQMAAVMEAGTVSQLRSAADAFSRLLREAVGHERERRAHDFVRQVQDIIDREYANIDLSVAYIAEKIGYQPKALSAAYKQKTERGLLDAIHTRRIEAAKELLAQTDKSVVDISLLTGYENVNTFIRVFKRYCGMTPGAFRASVGRPEE